MLEVRNITKTYITGDLRQDALKNVSISFREKEFVAILGHSGSGKTTLLNIIGGLDQYTDGDLIINGISTKKYKNRDWDAYRNNSVGFVFQSYNLIPHQTILANVELALTLSGVNSSERKQRAIDALEQVGLKDHIYKKPNQLSGGQMQRVAIARALINDPDIILADEPTGALDSDTSIQVMNILQEVAKRKLVIMVTHNPELAEQYATRIVRLTDGVIIDDSDPYNETSVVDETKKIARNRSMSFLTAFSLSLNNLMTKKMRTFMTSFAGSIGIMGIALILALSTGFQDYIDKIQEDTMTSYPLQIQSETADMFSAILSLSANGSNTPDDGKLVEQQYISTMFSSIGTNDLKTFKKYLEDNADVYKDDVRRINYSYSVSPLIYGYDATGEPVQLNPSTAMSSIYSGAMSSAMSMLGNSGVFQESRFNPDNYELLAGRFPESYDEVVISLSDKDKISDLLLYSLGFKENAKLKTLITNVMTGQEVENDEDPMVIAYDDLLNLDLRLIDPSDKYQYNVKYNTYEDMSNDADYMADVFNKSEKIKVVGLIWREDNGSAGVLYSPDLIQHVMETAKESSIVKKQLANKDIDIFSGNRFDEDKDKEGLDFNDMVSVDENMLKNAFKINADLSSLGDMGDMQNVIMKSSDAAVAGVKSMTVMMAQVVSSSNQLVSTSLITPYMTIGSVNEAIDCDNWADSSDKTKGCAFGEGETGRTYIEKDDLVAAIAELPDEAKAVFAGVADMIEGDSIEVEDMAEMIAGSSYGFISKEQASDMVTMLLKDIIKSEMPEGYETVGTMIYQTKYGYRTILSDASKEQYAAAAASDEVLKGIAEQTNEQIRQMIKTQMGSSSEMDDMLKSIALKPSTIKQIFNDAFDLFLEENKGQEIKDIPESAISNAVNAALVKNEMLVFNDAFEMAKGLSVGMTALQMANVVGEAMKPITDAFSGGKEFMSIDTNAFAKAFNFNMDEKEVSRLMESMLTSDSASYKTNLIGLGYQDVDDPSSISIFFNSFDSKANFLDFMKDYNEKADDDHEIKYTDITGLLMSSVEKMINSVTYVLIAFVSISLIVSSIMIGVITLISVMERTKEIGILRAIGASKKDVSNVFNVETFIIGLLSGFIGIGTTLILLIPINQVMYKVTEIESLKAVLPAISAIILILISVVLTLIAGLIPAKSAANKNPVEALRTE